jgi:hypothetical protein
MVTSLVTSQGKSTLGVDAMYRSWQRTLVLHGNSTATTPIQGHSWYSTSSMSNISVAVAVA